MPLENGEGWIRLFKSYERLFYNGNSDSISKVPPENAAAINKDTPESRPLKKITTAEALSQETEELEDSFDFGNQVIDHISNKDAISTATATTFIRCDYFKWFTIL